MSRTARTQPYRVRLWDGTLRRVAVHDHAAGACDLPRTLAEDLAAWASKPLVRRPRSYWDLDYTGTNVCACELCAGSLERRADRRRDRRRAARELREAVKTYRADPGVVD